MFFCSEKKIDEQGSEKVLQEIQEQIAIKTAEFIEGKTDTFEIDGKYEKILDALSNAHCQLNDIARPDIEYKLRKKHLYDNIESNITKMHSELNTEFSFRINLVAEKFLFCNHLMYFSTLKENSASATEIIDILLSQEEKNLCEYMQSFKKWFVKFYKNLEEFGRLADKLSESISKENSIEKSAPESESSTDTNSKTTENTK